MFGNNRTRNLLIIAGGILASLFALYRGSSIVGVSASTQPNFMLGNFTTNLTMPQALQIGNLSEQDVNLLKSMREESKGNLTKLYILLLDEMERRNIINNDDKQSLHSIFVGITEIKPSSNLTILNNDVSLLLDTEGSNTTNPTVATLLSTLNRVPPDFGLAPVSGNVTSGIHGLDNVTSGIPGLPPMTIGGFEIMDRWAKTQTCHAAGSLLTGGVGGYIAAQACDMII